MPTPEPSSDANEWSGPGAGVIFLIFRNRSSCEMTLCGQIDEGFFLRRKSSKNRKDMVNEGCVVETRSKIKESKEGAEPSTYHNAQGDVDEIPEDVLKLREPRVALLKF